MEKFREYNIFFIYILFKKIFIFGKFFFSYCLKYIFYLSFLLSGKLDLNNRSKWKDIFLFIFCFIKIDANYLIFPIESRGTIYNYFSMTSIWTSVRIITICIFTFIDILYIIYNNIIRRKYIRHFIYLRNIYIF